MKRNLLLFSLLIAGSVSGFAQIEDDIYYNPKKDASVTKSKKSNSNYIADFQDMDVDAYNRRGQYYTTPIDTIGDYVSSAQDFVNTTQIQKFYNPTIVLDNEALLADVLDNAIGNVNVEFNINGIPSFGPYFYWLPSRWNNLYFDMTPGWSISWGWGNPWWGSSLAWSWGPNWGYGPSWAYAPAWSWGPGWNWGWGPGWGYGPAWRPGPGYYADYRPGGNRPVGARPGWSNNTRPGYHYNANNTHGLRPGSNYNGGNSVATRPGYGRPSSSTSRPNKDTNQGTMGNNNHNGNAAAGNVNTGGYRQSGQGAFHSTRNSKTEINKNTSTRQDLTNSNRHNNSSNSNWNTNSNNSNRNNNSTHNNTYRNSGNSTRNSGNSSHSSGSYNRSSGAFGGQSSGGYRSSGGSRAGGSRGGRR